MGLNLTLKKALDAAYSPEQLRVVEKAMENALTKAQRIITLQLRKDKLVGGFDDARFGRQGSLIWEGAPEEAGFDATWVLLLQCNPLKKHYRIYSFGTSVEPKTLKGFVAALAKVEAIVRKGLKTLPPEYADYVQGKLSTAVVQGVLKVTAEFDSNDEWHDTRLTILLALRTKKKVPISIVKDWLRANWSEVQKKAPPKTPQPAGPNPGYNYGDYPATGLGWLVPNQMTYSEITDWRSSQSDNIMEIKAGSAIR